MDYSINKKELYNSIKAIVESCNYRLIEIDLNSTSLIRLTRIYLVAKQLDININQKTQE